MTTKMFHVIQLSLHYCKWNPNKKPQLSFVTASKCSRVSVSCTLNMTLLCIVLTLTMALFIEMSNDSQKVF